VNPFIGLVRMDEHDAMNASIRVGADVVSGLRGRGYGRKIYEAIKKYCFHYLNVHRVWLLVLETNKHARRLYKKQGFRVEGKQRKAIFRDGEYLDYVMMSILEDEYRGGK
jgi:RimJ/RimL family protein N-acetyltransferase